jgi:type VI secretion system protein ImpE
MSTSIQELFRSGLLEEATRAQGARVRESPGNGDERISLFGLLCASGELERAQVQLETLRDLGPSHDRAAVLYGPLLEGEEERRRVFEEDWLPAVPKAPHEHVQHRIRALIALREGDHGGAASALAAASAAAPVLSGAVDGEDHAGIEDLDELLGPVLEVIAGGRYLWLPLEEVALLELRPARTTLDLVWAQAKLVRRDGTESHVHVPVCYHGTRSDPDPRVKLGRITRWEDHLGVAFRGRGQRMLRFAGAGGGVERQLLAIRTIAIRVQP